MATLGVAAGVHCLLVASILRQPLDVSTSGGPYALTGPLHYDSVRRSGPGADFFSLYRAGVQARRGLSVYYWRESPPVTPYAYDYRYLPVVAQSLGRLATTLPPRRAWQAWVLTIEATLALLLVALQRVFRSPRWRTGVTCLLLLSMPYLLELHMGQFTFMATALTAMAALTVHTGRGGPWRTALAAGAYATAVVLKIFPIVAVIALVRDRRGRLVSGLAVTVIVLVGAAGLVTDPEFGVRVLRASVLGNAIGLDAGNHGPAYLSFVTARLVNPALPYQDWVWPARILRVTVLGLAAWAVLFGRRGDLLAGVGLVLIGHFASFLLLWEHHVSGALVAGVLLLAGMQADVRNAADTRRIAYAAACLVLLALPTPYVLMPPGPSAWTPWMFLILPSSKTLPLLALFGLGVGWMRTGRTG